VFDPMDPMALKRMSNEKILANYNKRKSASDPGMPCIQPAPACPCWSEAQFDAAFVNDGTQGIVTCDVDEDRSVHNGPFVLLQEAGTGLNNVAQTFDFAALGGIGCFFDDKTAVPQIFVILGGLEQADFDACSASMQSQTIDVGGTCIVQ